MRRVALALGALSLSCCSSSDECREYSDFTCNQIESAEYNVYFYYPDDKEVFLGETTGLDSCGSIAWDFAAQKKLSENQDWGYVCCMIANGSSCYEKHR